MYRSPAVFDAELDRIIRAGWIAVAHTSQLEQPGSYRCVDAAGEMLVVTRDRGGVLHVLSRVCPHRWMELCSGTGSARVLQCPYHHWTFGLAGDLRSAPAMDEDFDKESSPLKEFRHTVWEGFVFVNVDGKAASPSELWGPLEDHLESYDLSSWTVVSTTDWGDRPWDWKVLMDNGECYHHLGLHRDSLEPLYPARRARDLPDNGNFTCIVADPAALRSPSATARWIGRVVDAGFGIAPSLATGRAPELFSAASPRLRRRLTLASSRAAGDPSSDGMSAPLVLAYPFPNYALALLPDVGFWYEAHPTAAGSTRLRTHQLLPRALASGREARARIARNDALLRVIHSEDEEVCSAVQRGLGTRSTSHGRLGPLERHNETFARWYEAAMEGWETTCAC